MNDIFKIRLQNYYFFLIYANISCIFTIILIIFTPIHIIIIINTFKIHLKITSIFTIYTTNFVPFSSIESPLFPIVATKWPNMFRFYLAINV